MTTSCPFQIGDRIHELAPVVGLWSMSAEEAATFIPPMDLDRTKPDATVTAITERGFEYRYDYPILIGRAQWNQMTTGGEVYEEGSQYWRKVDRMPIYSMEDGDPCRHHERWWMWDNHMGYWKRWQRGWSHDEHWTLWSPDAPNEPPQP